MRSCQWLSTRRRYLYIMLKMRRFCPRAWGVVTARADVQCYLSSNETAVGLVRAMMRANIITFSPFSVGHRTTGYKYLRPTWTSCCKGIKGIVSRRWAAFL